MKRRCVNDILAGYLNSGPWILDITYPEETAYIGLLIPSPFANNSCDVLSSCTHHAGFYPPAVDAAGRSCPARAFPSYFML